MTHRSPSRSAFLFLVILLLLPIGFGVHYVYQKHQWAVNRMAEIEPRYARLLGLIDAQPVYAEASDKAQAFIRQYAHPGDIETVQAGNNAQQQVRGVLVSAGLQVVSSQVLPHQKGPRFNRIPLILRLEGDWLALHAAQVALAEITPLVVLDGWTVQTVGAAKPDVAPRLSVQINLSVYQVAP